MNSSICTQGQDGSNYQFRNNFLGGITWWKVLRNSKIGPHIVPQNHKKIGPIIMVSIHIKPLVKHPEPLPELLESLFRKLNGLELDGNKKCSTISRHGLNKYFPFFCVNGQNKWNTQISIAPIRIFLHLSGENISWYLICSDPLYNFANSNQLKLNYKNEHIMGKSAGSKSVNKLIDDKLPDGHWGKFKAKYNPSKMAFKSGSE